MKNISRPFKKIVQFDFERNISGDKDLSLSKIIEK